jgi:hypothetical protein
MAGWRGFRYQTGEAEEFVPVLRQEGIIQADIDWVEEVETYIQILSEYDIVPKEGAQPDFRALDGVENPEFYARYTFLDKDGRTLYIDFFHVEEPEETYDSVDLG